MSSNPIAMKTIKSNTIFTNVAKTSDGGVYWEGIDDDAIGPNVTITSWKNQENWQPGDKTNPSAHPNSRFYCIKCLTVLNSLCAIIDVI